MAKADIQLVSKMDVFHLSDIIQNSHTCVWNLQRVGIWLLIVSQLFFSVSGLARGGVKFAI